MKNNTILISIALLLAINLVSAGVGIKWDKESSLVKEGEKTCITYKVYNPWPEENWVTIELSEELKPILIEQEVDTKLIPANTPSSQAIPVNFCFKVPIIYEEDCLLMDKFICKKDYQGEIKNYKGEVLVKSVQAPTKIGGSGGSATAMAVSAPLAIKVEPKNHARNFALIYGIIALLSLLFIIILLYKRYSRSDLERDEDRLRKLKDRIKKEKSKKK
ncbi:MAG: hypothetical protein WC867_00580 [Candidatus Pacearchaeota archaeon]|jgi:hypothetical protein